MKAHRCLIVAALATLGGCMSNGDDGNPSPTNDASEDVGASEADLKQRIRYSDSCTPFAAAYLDRSTFYSRTVAHSPAFRACVQNTMLNQYMNCGDPNEVKPPTEQSKVAQTAVVLKMLEDFDNALYYDCHLSSDGDASATYQGHATYDEHGIAAKGAYDEDYPDWSRYGTISGPGSDFEPWQWRAATPVHEFAHTHDFRHPGNCSDREDNDGDGLTNCDDPDCKWTLACPCEGTPCTRPSPPQNREEAGESRQEFCATEYDRPSDAYFVNGEPSVPYILSGCAIAVVRQSHGVCGKATTGCNDPSQLRLLSSWSGTMTTTQASTSCACESDPRRELTLRTSGGYFVTAENGGSGVLRTNWTTSQGPWQTFWTSPPVGDLVNWSSVHVRAWNGSILGPDFRLTASTPQTIQIGTNALASGAPIRAGHVVNLSDMVGGAQRWAYDNGSTVAWSATRGGSNYNFTVFEPRRARLVYLRTYHGTYVYGNTSTTPRRLYGSRSENNIEDGLLQQRVEAAFWVIDHDGGELEDGDSVSFEIFANDLHHYWSTVDGEGHMRLANAFGPYETFVVNKLSGSSGTVIKNTDVISLRSAQGRYVTATPSSSSWQLQNYATYEGTWQQLTVRDVSQFDRARPTW